jgi:CheY-like chemotaxis protein
METILLVDDDVEVLEITREMLERLGYLVLDALSAEEAVRVALGHPGPIQLLLTDVVMPGASGHDLAQQLALPRPEMKVLYMSAFTLVKGQQQFADAAETGHDHEAPIILKPSRSSALPRKSWRCSPRNPPRRSTARPTPGRTSRPRATSRRATATPGHVRAIHGGLGWRPEPPI